MTEHLPPTPISDLPEPPPRDPKEWTKKAGALQELLVQYSINDVFASLFVIDMLLPNVACPTRLAFLATAAISIPRDKFQDRDTITAYDDFRRFFEALVPLLPSFDGFDDFVPEPDWGQIRFSLQDRVYRILYGSCISNLDGYLRAFVTVHKPLDGAYKRILKTSAMADLGSALAVQDHLIACIGPQEPAKDITPGQTILPPVEFWERARAYYSHFPDALKLPPEFVSRYSAPVGTDTSAALATDEAFAELAYNGTLVPKCFLQHDGRHFPILPRRYLGILFDYWGNTLRQNKSAIEKMAGPLNEAIKAEVERFTRKRISKDALFTDTSAIYRSGKPHPITFCLSIRSRDKLFLFYVTPPALSAEDISNHLTQAIPLFKEALGLIRVGPTSLGLLKEKKIVRFESRERPMRGLDPVLYAVIPQVTTEPIGIKVEKEFPGRLMFLDAFLAILDEIREDADLSDFHEFLLEYEKSGTMPLLSLLDIFAAFRDSSGVLIGGALKIDWISLDPHWGCRFRYLSLETFWSQYPPTTLLGDPGEWRIEKHSDTSPRLIARNRFASALYCKLRGCHVILTAPFEALEPTQGRPADFLMQCVEDSLSRNRALLETLKFPDRRDTIKIHFFAASLLSSSENYSNLRHLVPTSGPWKADLAPGSEISVRVGFSDAEIVRVFSEATDSSLETALLLAVLDAIHAKYPDQNYLTVRGSIEGTKYPPRFKFTSYNKEVAFPEFARVLEPETGDFKRAKKRMAELARDQGLAEGEYELEAAKLKLNQLKAAMVQEINGVLAAFPFEVSLTRLLTYTDALINKNERDMTRAELSLEHEVDFAPDVLYAERSAKFTQMHRNYRYLIEKVVQLEPSGAAQFSSREISYLLAFVDWLHVIQSASDCLHYGINPVGLKINNEFLITVNYGENFSESEDAFGKLQAQVQLGMVGKSDDKASDDEPVKDYIHRLDEAFNTDFGFRFVFLANALHIMSIWSGAHEGAVESTFYSASQDDLVKAFLKYCAIDVVPPATEEEFKKIIAFLTLRKDLLLRIPNQSGTHPDLPIWEHAKRPDRYTLRPLIKVGDKYYWGPYSAMKAGKIWAGAPVNGTLPADIGGEAIKRLLKDKKKAIEDSVESKAYEIVGRFTPHIQKNLFLHLFDRAGNHPEDLGDYDVLAYVPAKHLFVNVECKDMSMVYCLKDAKRLRERIFGTGGADRGHFNQIDKREQYLLNNWAAIGQKLSWPLASSTTPPTICTLYVTNRDYWWTRFPPMKVTADFVELRLLDAKLSSITQ